MTRLALLGVGTAAALLVARPAPAQIRLAQEPATVEVWGGLSDVAAPPAGSFISSYSPPLLFDGSFASHGEQVIALDGQRAVGVNGGVNFFVASHAGIQLLADWAAIDVAGSNQPYEYSLQYTTRLPPNDTPAATKIAQSIAWPDTSGTLKSLALAFNGVMRIGHVDRVSATLSAGPAYYRMSGSFAPVAFTAFHLGGHSVLFEDDYRLALRLESKSAWGYNFGGDLDVALGRHAAVLFGYRYFGGPAADVTVAVSSVVNPEQIALAQPLADIASQLAAAPARINIGSSRVVVGLKLMK